MLGSPVIQHRPEVTVPTKDGSNLFGPGSREAAVPQTTAIPDWPKYQSQTKPAMMINLEFKVMADGFSYGGKLFAGLTGNGSSFR
jgi:hypothetical protein